MEQEGGTTSDRITRIFKDVVLPFLYFVAVLVVAIIFYAVPEPFQRGFYCDDQTIAYPFRSDTVSARALLLGSILGPIVVIVCCEILVAFIAVKPRPSKRRTLLTITHWGYRFVYGYALCMLFTACIKIITGRLRPDFIAVCRPDWSAINCSRFVSNATCLTTSRTALHYARTSFPSGHSSSAVFSATYVTMYLALRAPSIKLEFVKPILQSTALLLAAFCAISRVCDNKHHWQDVLAGAICGAAIALAILRYHLTALFGSHSPSSSSDMRSIDPTNQTLTELTMRSLDAEKAHSQLATVCINND